MAKLSVGQALLKAKSHGKKGEFEEAQKLYQTVLQAFPKNKRAQQGLAALNKPKQSAITQGPPQETINQLVNLYNQGQFEEALEAYKKAISAAVKLIESAKMPLLLVGAGANRKRTSKVLTQFKNSNSYQICLLKLKFSK